MNKLIFGAIIGDIVGAYYGIPQKLIKKAMTYFDDRLNKALQMIYK